jgi:hypothetical protein
MRAEESSAYRPVIIHEIGGSGANLFWASGFEPNAWGLYDIIGNALQPDFKNQKRHWRMSETNEGQKARYHCNIGTQPVKPAVYGVNVPL